MTTVSTVAAVDARSANWQFLVPAVPHDPLILEAGCVLPGPDCVRSSGIVVPDAGGWAPLVPATDLLGRVSALVPAGGWLLTGFANPWFPGARLAHSRLGLAAAVRRMRSRGLVSTACYAALPDHQHPSVLVPVSRRAELDDLLHRVPVTFVDHDTRAPRVARRVRQLARAGATISPHRLRVVVMPGYFVLARRPT